MKSDVIGLGKDTIGFVDGLGMQLEGKKDQRKMLNFKLVDLGR